MNQNDNKDETIKKPLYIRILALITVIILIGLITATLIVGVTGGPKNLLFALIFSDIIIPICIYALLLITRIVKNKNKK